MALPFFVVPFVRRTFHFQSAITPFHLSTPETIFEQNFSNCRLRCSLRPRPGYDRRTKAGAAEQQPFFKFAIGVDAHLRLTTVYVQEGPLNPKCEMFAYHGKNVVRGLHTAFQGRDFVRSKFCYKI